MFLCDASIELFITIFFLNTIGSLRHWVIWSNNVWPSPFFCSSRVLSHGGQGLGSYLNKPPSVKALYSGSLLFRNFLDLSISCRNGGPRASQNTQHAPRKQNYWVKMSNFLWMSVTFMQCASPQNKSYTSNQTQTSFCVGLFLGAWHFWHT